MGETSTKIELDVGNLSSFGNLVFNLGPSLRKYSKNHILGQKSNLEWNLNHLEFGNIRLSTITAFLSIAYRLRRFYGEATHASIYWEPNLLELLEGVGFFKIDRELNLFRWTKDIIGGYKSGRMNPHTKIIYFEDDIPERTDIEKIILWKKDKRAEIEQELIADCGHLFAPKEGLSKFTQRIVEITTSSIAELAVNSILHGRDPAFVGLQRSTSGISISVCDSGRGFPTALKEEFGISPLKPKLQHINALFFGSVMRIKEAGLRELIPIILDNNGWVVMSSFNAKILWQKKIWNQLISNRLIDINDPYSMNNLSEFVGEPLSGKISQENRENGYYRIWSQYLRGTRISFEISFNI